MDNALLDVIRAIPQQAQRQYGTDEQLRYLMAVANKLGLYDAADFVRRGLRDDDDSAEQFWVRPEQAHTCTFPCELWGEGPDGRGNCYGYNEDHLPYEDTDYRCHTCKRRLGENDNELRRAIRLPINPVLNVRGYNP